MENLAWNDELTKLTHNEYRISMYVNLALLVIDLNGFF